MLFKWHTDRTGRVAISYDINRQLMVSEVQHMAEKNVLRFIDNSTTVSSKVNATESSNDAICILNQMVRDATIAALVLGIPGNILSAIIWLRRHVTSKNSSAIYLAALAVVDLAALTLRIMLLHFPYCTGWFRICCWYLHASVQILDPLLLLGFSVERLIAILRPFQVGYFHIWRFCRVYASGCRYRWNIGKL